MTPLELTTVLKEIIANNTHYTTWTVSTPHLIALVNKVVADEREACAKVCEQMWHEWLDSPEDNEPNKPDAEDCYKAIRERNNQ